MVGRTYSAQALIALPNPKPVITRLCHHMLEHGAEVSRQAGEVVLRLSGCTARFFGEGARTCVEIEAPDFEHLYFARMTIASHILEFAGEAAPEIRWSGDSDGQTRPPNFQVLTVIGSHDVTPHMRRLRFRCQNAARFAGLDALHLNLLIQRPELRSPVWPSVASSGVIEWEDPDHKPFLRKYTVRSVDVETEEIEIDFVIHSDVGPGSRFAETVVIGTEVGVFGPGGGGLVVADWYLFAGDETALPAIARMFANLPFAATGIAYIEVADGEEIQALESSAAVDVRWLVRNGAKPGSLLVDAVRNSEFPEDGRSIYLWAACEHGAFKTIRQFVREQTKLKRDEQLVVSYWRAGTSS